MLTLIKVSLPIMCILYNFKTKTASLEGIQILDTTAVFERLLKRMTEIERGLNLHLNYNITKISPKKKMFARRVRKQSIEQEEDGTQKTGLSSEVHDLVNNFLPDGNFSVKNSRERTCQKTPNRIRQKISPKISDLSTFNDKNNGGTMGPKPIRTRNRKQKLKYKKGRTIPVNHKYPESGDHYIMPLTSTQCSVDSKCGCCRENPPASPKSPQRLNKAEIDAIQKRIDDLTARGCKVFHFQGSIVYSCENK